MSDGKIEINAREILDKHLSWSKGEQADASNAGKRREAIGAYRDGKGINAKAFSQFRAGMKIKQEGDRRDWVRSLRLLLEVAEAEIFANEQDMFDGGAVGGDGAVQADAAPDAPEADLEQAIRDGDPELAGEAAEFDANVEQVDFSGAAAE